MLSIKKLVALAVCHCVMTLTPPTALVMGQELLTLDQALAVDMKPNEDVAPVRRLRAEGYGGYGAPTGGKSYGGGGYGGNGYNGGASTGGRSYGSGKSYGGGGYGVKNYGGSGASFGGNSYGGKSYGGGAPLGGFPSGGNGYSGGKGYSGGGGGGIPIVFGSFPAPAGNIGGYAQGGYLNGDAFAPATVAPMDSASVGTSYGDNAPAIGPASNGYTVQTGGAY